MYRLAVCLGLACAIIGSRAHATTHILKPDGTGDFPTIQAAIVAASDGDTILLEDGIYSGDGNRDVTFDGKAITLQSMSLVPEECIVHCSGSLSEPYRGFIFSQGETSDTVLRGISVCYAVHSQGAAAYCGEGATPTFEKCVFRDNLSTHSSDGGGAIYCGGSTTISECVFKDNAATRGGAVLCRNPNTVTISNCLFRDNYASVHGGAVYCHGVPVLSYCQFINNEAGGQGGAVFGGPFYLDRCTFSGNIAADVGAAVSTAGSTIESCTFCGDNALQGGVISVGQGGDVTLSNSIIAHSVVSPALTCEGNCEAVLDCCDIYGNAGGDWVGCIADQAGLNGNISLDPLICGATYEDYFLEEGSPCAPFSDPNPECDLIGAWPVGCGQEVAVCCLEETCELMTAEECHHMAGEWFHQLLICDPNPCTSSVIRVRADGSGDYPTIQDAINGARDGDVIELEAGVYTGDGNRDLLLHRKEITIRSATGFAGTCIIDCEGSAADAHRAFRFELEGPATTIEDIVVVNGHASHGAGVLFDLGSSPTLRACVFADNNAETTGGGIHVVAGEPSIEGCYFENNSAPGGGGGAYYGGQARCQLFDCTFEGNQSVSGRGGGLLAEGDVDLFGSLFVSNVGPQGGAIALIGTDANITSTTLYGNHASEGGGIWCSGGSLLASSCIISFGTSGDAVHCASGFTAVMECCDIFGNAGGDWVGCIDWLAGLYGNINLDPMFCDPTVGNYYLRAMSPCAPHSAPNPECDLIGALPVNCSFMGTEEPSVPGLEGLHIASSQNPATSEVRLSYVLPEKNGRTRTTLAVYDLTGRLVDLLVDEVQSPGPHEVLWNSRRLRDGRSGVAGVLFCRLTVSGETVTKRILIMD